MEYAIPGGLIGVGTTLDPAYTKGNKLTGQIITLPGKNLRISSRIGVIMDVNTTINLSPGYLTLVNLDY